jgi:hypothetical protein
MFQIERPAVPLRAFWQLYARLGHLVIEQQVNFAQPDKQVFSRGPAQLEQFL